MKKISFFALMYLLYCSLSFAQVSVNSDGTSSHGSAMLDIGSESKGFLLPRMTMAQLEGILSPATGLLVYCVDDNNFFVNRGTELFPDWNMVNSKWKANGPHIYYTGQNVGIGWMDPIAKLDIRGSNPDEPTAFMIGNSDLSHRLILNGGRQTDPDPFIQWKQGDALRFATDESGGAERMRITSIGQVGIGTAVPDANLHVAEQVLTHTSIFGTSISTVKFGTNVAIGDGNFSSILYIGQGPMDKGYLHWHYDEIPSNAYLGVGTYGDINPLVLQEAGGRVGIITTTPVAKLHVAEDGPDHTAVFGESISGWIDGTNVSIGDTNNHSLLYIGQDVWYKGFLIWHRDPVPENAYFSVGTYDSDNPLILNEAGGNVGIGTISPRSRMEIYYFDGNYNLLGYNIDTLNYFRHKEFEAEGDGQSALFAYRTRDVSNDGIDYTLTGSNVAMKGYSFWGDQYSFGTAGFNDNDDVRCGGILGAYTGGSHWGALGYKSSGATGYGGYFTSSANGTGKSNEYIYSGIGIGAWGDLMAADFHGKIYGIYAEGERFAMFSHGATYKDDIDVHLQKNGNGSNTTLYTNVSTDVSVQTWGVATLSDGKANITFDPAFSASVSSEAPLVVTITPIGESNGVHLAKVTTYGITVVENNNGKSNVTVNYIAIGKRAGYENPILPPEVIDAAYTGKMNRGLHNDADTQTNGEGLFYENGLLSVGIHPSTHIGQDKPAEKILFHKADKGLWEENPAFKPLQERKIKTNIQKSGMKNALTGKKGS
jgi:hypothetical protein